jgi:hypothetical protein
MERDKHGEILKIKYKKKRSRTRNEHWNAPPIE